MAGEKKQAIDWLRDWSKWLITINFAAATGCTLVLKGGADSWRRGVLTIAIIAFSVSVILSIAVVRVLSTLIEQKHVLDDQHHSILENPLCPRITLRRATRLQFAAMIVAIVCSVAWAVAPKPNTGSHKSQYECCAKLPAPANICITNPSTSGAQ